VKISTPNLPEKLSEVALSRRSTICKLGAVTASGLLSSIFSVLPSTTIANSARPTGFPAELDEFGSQIIWRRRGTATLRVLLFKVYDATLWSIVEKTNPLEEAAPFALDITYSLAVKRDDLVDTSMQEMVRLRNPNPATLGRWNASLKTVFPSVVSGDRLLGVSLPGKGARFYHNGKLTGDITDGAFSEAFFAIWLDGNTKKPDVRRALLGA
jgi:hypothetical protein